MVKMKKNYNFFNKKSQSWAIDLMIASVIFLTGIIVFYIYSLNQPNEGKEVMAYLSYDGKIVSNTILTDGYPKDWNTTNVIKIGIISNDKINNTKLENFYNLTKTDSAYENTKLIFDTKYDYYFFLDGNMNIGGTYVDGVGKPGANRSNITTDINPKNLIKITRFVVYNDEPTTAYLYVWEK
jgi:hypothetical protein